MGIAHLDGAVQTLTSVGLSHSTISSYNSGVRCYSLLFTVQPSSLLLSELNLSRFMAFLAHNHLYLSALRHHQILTRGNDPSFDLFHMLHYVLHSCHRSLPPTTRPKRLPITPAVPWLLHPMWSVQAHDYNTVYGRRVARESLVSCAQQNLLAHLGHHTIRTCCRCRTYQQTLETTCQ